MNLVIHMSVVLPSTLSEASVFALPHLVKFGTSCAKASTKPLPKATITYGVETGGSGLLVIDLDRNHDDGADGIASFREILSAEGHELPHGFRVRTPKGGVHIYFRLERDLALNGRSRYWPGVDVKTGRNQYVVGPGSIVALPSPELAKQLEGMYHRDSPLTAKERAAIRAELEASPRGQYSVVEPTAEIPVLPEWLAVLLEKRAARQADAQQTSKLAVQAVRINGDATLAEYRYAKAALDNATVEMGRTAAGNRNGRLNELAYGLGKAGVPVDVAVASLTAAALTTGLSQAEVRNVLPRAVEQGAARADARATVTDWHILASEDALAVRKPATSVPAAGAASTPRLTSQKGKKAVAPLVKSLLEEQKGSPTDHLLAYGEKAGRRQVALADFISAVQDGIAAAPTTSLWHGYDLSEGGEESLREGWKKGQETAAEKQAQDAYFGPDSLTLRFVEENPHYRWLSSRQATSESSGAWVKYEDNTFSRDYGIYRPYPPHMMRDDVITWIRTQRDDLSNARDLALAAKAQEALDNGRLVDEVMRRLRGRSEYRAFTEDFDTSTHEIVDMRGIRDLNTGLVRPCCSDFLVTRKIYFCGDEQNWQKHQEDVERIMSSCHPQDRAYYEAMLGTILRNQQPLSKKGALLWGPSKDNGKTTGVEINLKVLGADEAVPFAIKADHSIVQKHGDNKYEAVNLHKKTLTILDDFNTSKEVDAERLKQYIGSGSGRARAIRAETQQVDYFHTFFITSNRLPNFGRGEDVLDRFEVILFPYKYPSDDQYDPSNPWHRRRDPLFTARVSTDRDLQDAWYYHLLQLHVAWAEAPKGPGSAEIEAINDHIRANKDNWKGKTNTLHAVLTEYAAPDPEYFVTEKTLLAFLAHQLKEQGHGVFGVQTLRTELEGLLLLQQWKVEAVRKTPRHRSPHLRNLKESVWAQGEFATPTPAPAAAAIFTGLRLRTNDRGRWYDEDEWEQVNQDRNMLAEAEKSEISPAVEFTRDESFADPDDSLFLALDDVPFPDDFLNSTPEGEYS